MTILHRGYRAPHHGLLIAVALCAALEVQEANAAEITSPVVDGMVLHLGDYVQRVAVRAKASGPGACAVTFSIGGQNSGFLAPPSSWSPWTEIGPGFVGKSAQKLGYSVNCDTDAIAEVRYSK